MSETVAESAVTEAAVALSEIESPAVYAVVFAGRVRVVNVAAKALFARPLLSCGVGWPPLVPGGGGASWGWWVAFVIGIGK